MKVQHCFLFALGGASISLLSACGTAAPAFSEMSLTGTEHGISVAESDATAFSTRPLPEALTPSESILSTSVSAGTVSQFVSKPSEGAAAENTGDTEDSITGNDASEIFAASSSASNATTSHLPSDRNPEAVFACLPSLGAEAGTLPESYSFVQAKNTNSQIVFRDAASHETLHTIEIVTKNANKGVLDLLNPSAAYCIKHDGWNANTFVVRVACGARIVEIDQNYHVANRLRIERIGCEM